MKTNHEIDVEWNLLTKEWFNIYNWKTLNGVGYSDYVAGLILKDFDSIFFDKTGLRNNNFKQCSHIGQADTKTDISNFKEKRFCRALYNKKNIDSFGQMLDYEVPLTAPKQGNGKMGHGDIDLLSLKGKKLLVIEAKKLNSTESILKALIQVYTYTNKLQSIKNQFFNEFKISSKYVITPVILTFELSASGKQIHDFNSKPHLNVIKLIEKLNSELAGLNVNPIEFYLISGEANKITNSLELIDYSENLKKPEFKKSFYLKIYQCFSYCSFDSLINICEQNNCLSNDLEERNISFKEIETALIEILKKDKNEAIKYVQDRILKVQNEISNYNKLVPKTEKDNIEINQLFKGKDFLFIERFLAIVAYANYYEFVPLLLSLLNKYRYKQIIPVISKHKTPEVLKSLIDAYHNLPITGSKDYDGVIHHQIDMDIEALVARALCEMDDKSIVNSLKQSLLFGGYAKTEVLKKLRTFIPDEEIFNEYSNVVNNSNNLFDFSNHKGNAKWVLENIKC